MELASQIIIVFGESLYIHACFIFSKLVFILINNTHSTFTNKITQN